MKETYAVTRVWLAVVSLAGFAAAFGTFCFPASVPVGGEFPNTLSVNIRIPHGGRVGIGFEFGASSDESLYRYIVLAPSNQFNRVALPLPAGTITVLRLMLPGNDPRASARDARVIDAQGRMLWQFADSDIRADGRITLRANLRLPTDPHRRDRQVARERSAAVLLAMTEAIILMTVLRWRNLALVSPLWFARIAISVAAASVLFSRRPGFFVQPQFWAEDGAVYFLGRTKGWHGLWETQGNYLVLVPRTIAAMANLAPIWYAPILYAAFATVVCLATVIKAASPRVGLPFPALAGLAVVFVPNMDEITANLTNLQWFGAVILVLVCLSKPPSNLRETVRDSVALGIFGLTGPYIIFALPLLFWRALHARSFARWMLPALGVGLSLLQYRAYSESHPVLFSGDLPSFVPFLAAAGYRTGGQLFRLMPAPLVTNPIPWGLGGLALFASIWLVFPLRPRGEGEDIRSKLAWMALAIIGAGFLRYINLANQFFEQLFITRYFYFPLLCAAWLLLGGVAMPGLTRWIAAIGLFAAIMCNVSNYRMAPYTDLHWPHYALAMERRQPTLVPVNPPAWFFHFAGGR